MRPSVLLVGLVALLPLRARAQDNGNAEPVPHVSPALGVHYGSPLRISIAGGLLVDMSKHLNDGIVMAAEAGQQGNELSVGYFRMFGWFGSGYSLRAAALRTKEEPWNASPLTTYAGVEGHFMIVFGVGARLGYLRRVSKRVDDEHDSLASMGLSIGF